MNVHRRERVLQSYINRRRIIAIDGADEDSIESELPTEPKHLGFGRWLMPDGTKFNGSKEEMLERLAE